MRIVSLLIQMLPAVQLDHQLAFDTAEICDEWTNGVLTPEAVAN